MDLGDRAGSERLPGAALPRNPASVSAPGEVVEAELDSFISRRHRERVKTEGGRAEEAVWKESEWRHEAARRAANAAAWHEYHQDQAARHRAVLTALIAHHEAEAERYLPKGAA